MTILKRLFLCKLIAFSAFITFALPGLTAPSDTLQKALKSSTPISTGAVWDADLRDLLFWINAQKKAPRSISFENMKAFIERHPDWPGTATLQKQVERELSEGTLKPAEAIAFFQKHPPLTTTGALIYLRALTQNRPSSQGAAYAQKTWVTICLSPAEQKSFFQIAQAYLTPRDHTARLRHMLFQGLFDQAKQTLPHLSASDRALAVVALALAEDKPEGGRLYQKLSPAHRQDPLVIWGYLKGLRLKKDYPLFCKVALTLPAHLPHPSDALGFYKLRLLAARELLEMHRFHDAFQALKHHGLSPTDPVNFMDAEWHLGWILLTFLKNPRLARPHFEACARVAKSPISLARTGYWLGRTYAAMGDAQASRLWYGKASRHKTTFYGQLASRKLGRCEIPLLLQTYSVSSAQQKAFNGRSIVKAVRWLAPLGPLGREAVAHFLCALGASCRTRADRQLTLRLAQETHPWIAADLSRSIQRHDPFMPLLESAYPLLPTPGLSAEDRALVHAVIHKETRFNPTMLGDAGELGLMQIMPNTAVMTAERLGIPHKPSNLLIPEYGIRLGLAHLKHYAEELGTAAPVSLIVTAYNAGIGAVKRWISTIGHPTGAIFGVRESHPDDQLALWSESIPYETTRDYHQRVFENLTVFRHRVGLQSPSCATPKPKSTLKKRQAGSA